MLVEVSAAVSNEIADMLFLKRKMLFIQIRMGEKKWMTKQKYRALGEIVSVVITDKTELGSYMERIEDIWNMWYIKGICMV